MFIRPTAALLRHVVPKAKGFAPASRTAAAPPTPPKQPIIAESIFKTANPERIQRARKLPLYAGGAVVGVIGLYSIQLFIAANKPISDESVISIASQKDVSDRYDDTASSFDTEVGFSEWLMGINKKRKGLAGLCRGDVLEASCGTGRNLGYFPILGKSDAQAPITSLTFVDLSPQMVDMCKKKWEALYGHKQKDLRPGLVVRFMTGSVLDSLPSAPGSAHAIDGLRTNIIDGKGKGYNTIIQTMGLCSTPSPEKLLVNLAQHLARDDPDAKILLLEHGRSYMPWLNRILDNSAAKHADIHGCWFNRDIGEIIEEAAKKSGLVVTRERRFHLGTTWLFELRRADAKRP